MIMSNIIIRKIGKEDIATARRLFLILQEVFEVKEPSVADEMHLTRLLTDERFICFVVTANDKVLGGLTAYELPMYHTAYSECYIYDVGVHANYQRMGIGKQLIAALKEYCRTHNIKTMFVEAQEADGHAIEFYRSTGADEERVVHFNYDCE